jgi:uncharacterized protein (DUF885 family)
VPAWTRFETFLRDRYRPRARTQPGLSAWKDGSAAYARLIKHYTTTSSSPEQVHQLGLREVERLEREMQTIARDYGFTGTLSAFERDLADRPGMKFESQDEMLAYASDVLSALQPAMRQLFLHLPRARVGVRPIPADREASQASNYVAGTADGSRQAWFNMNTYRPRDQVKYTVEALVLHETIPGHHLQVGLARELEGVPTFQRSFNASAFSEGWGLYAEGLGSTLGVVYRDPPTRFGRLASERFRAVRLVVDTGLHAMGWSRDRAREYFAAHAPSQSLAEIATSRGRRRRWATNSDSSRFWSCATGRRRRSGPGSICASSTTSCCGTARFHWTCSRNKSTRTSPRAVDIGYYRGAIMGVWVMIPRLCRTGFLTKNSGDLQNRYWESSATILKVR